MKKIKRVSNNPNGRPKLDDKKEYVGIYIQASIIDNLGGKDQVRKLFSNLVSTK